MPKIFVCYRRDDSGYPAAQIYTALKDHFGSDSVIFDVDTIPLGVDFQNYLNNQLSKCDILLAVIGDKWIEVLKQRSDDPDDFVRIEITAALERDIPVVPVLVSKASMPKENDLPTELAKLAFRQATEVRSGSDLQIHIERLINRLEHSLSEGKASKNQGILHEPSATWSSPVRRNHWRYKVVAFDLDGTLLRGEGFEFSWEAVWRELAFGKAIQSRLKREYRDRSESDPSRTNRIRAYDEWCEKACAQFMSRGLTRRQLEALASNLRLTRNCREALSALRTQEVVTAIISGGINTFLEDAFPDYRKYIDFVFINELFFSPAGTLEGVRATPFDFQGKAEALDLVCERVGCTSAEAVFVGDHFNDEAIMLRVDRAIAYPPMDAVVSGVAHETISEDDLMAILPHILIE
jgi:HAD superfamily phosphoserine phosphatase-like hydrolase